MMHACLVPSDPQLVIVNALVLYVIWRVMGQVLSGHHYFYAVFDIPNI